MSNRRSSTKATRKNSLPEAIKIKIEKDCEEEEALVIQNFQPIARFDEQNKIKREAEISYELMVEDEGQMEVEGTVNHKNRCDKDLKTIGRSKNRMSEVQVKIEPTEVTDEYSKSLDSTGLETDLRINNSSSTEVIKQELEDVEVQISKIDITITEPKVKRRRINDDDLESQSSKKRGSSGPKSKTKSRTSENDDSDDRMTDNPSSDQDNNESSCSELQEHPKDSTDTSNKKEQKYFNIFDRCKQRSGHKVTSQGSEMSKRDQESESSRKRNRSAKDAKKSDYNQKGNIEKSKDRTKGKRSSSNLIQKTTEVDQEVSNHYQESQEHTDESSDNLNMADDTENPKILIKENKRTGNSKNLSRKTSKLSYSGLESSKSDQEASDDNIESEESVAVTSKSSTRAAKPKNSIKKDGNTQKSSRTARKSLKSTETVTFDFQKSVKGDTIQHLNVVDPNSRKNSRSSTKNSQKSTGSSKKLTSNPNTSNTESKPSKLENLQDSSTESPETHLTQLEDTKTNIKLQELTSKSKKTINNSKFSTRNNSNHAFDSDNNQDSNKHDLHSRLSIEDSKPSIQDIKDPNLTSIFTKPLKIAQKFSIAVQKKFQCKLCPKSFDKQVGLKNHQAFHSTLQIPCPKCDLVFKNQRNFDNHKCPVCEVCGRKFKFQAKLIRHMTYVHADQSTLKMYECDLCDKKLRYKVSIERHMIEHLEVTKNMRYKCEVCHKTFKKRMGLGMHMILHADATFKCERCGVKFKKVRAYKQHKCLICKLCSKLFTSKTKLVDHVRNVHTDESLLELYICDICGKNFKYRMSITRHVLDHLEVANFDCETCQKKFKSYIALRDHIRICHARELITCKICHKQMKPQCIYQHMKVVHTVVRNFECQVCDAAFKTKDKLKRHMDTHDRKFKCDFCDRMFSSMYELTEHVNWHENPDIYQCQVCQKSFATRTSLNTHSKLHKGIVRNLQCPHCPFKTHRKESIKYHLTTHEKRDKKLEMKKNWLKCEVCGALLKSKASLWGHHRKVHPAEKMICDICGVPVKTKHSMKLHMENKHLTRLD